MSWVEFWAPLLLVVICLTVSTYSVWTWRKEDKARAAESMLLVAQIISSKDSAVKQKVEGTGLRVKFRVPRDDGDDTESEAVTSPDMSLYLETKQNYWKIQRLPGLYKIHAGKNDDETINIVDIPPETIGILYERDENTGKEEFDHSWLRNLPSPASVKLKAQLVKACMVFVDKHRQYHTEMEHAWRLYQQELLPNEIWEVIRQTYESYEICKTDYVCEAERLQDGFGDKIMETAVNMYRHMLVKEAKAIAATEAEKTRKKKIKEQERQEELKIHQKKMEEERRIKKFDDDKKKADQIAADLLRDESRKRTVASGAKAG